MLKNEYKLFGSHQYLFLLLLQYEIETKLPIRGWAPDGYKDSTGEVKNISVYFFLCLIDNNIDKETAAGRQISSTQRKAFVRPFSLLNCRLLQAISKRSVLR